MLLSSIPVAYALARLRWRGRDAVFLLVLASMMLPAQVTVVPLYVMCPKLHLVGSLTPLILPNWFGDAFSIFLLRQFFLTIPEEYADAARVDGCGELRILLSVVAAAGPAGDRGGRAVPVPLLLERLLRPAALHGRERRSTGRCRSASPQFRTLYQVQWNLTMAATLLFMVPVIALFFAAQKAFVEGVTLTGVKG